MAAIIASQALISGAFSLTQQASSSAIARACTIVHTSQHRARADLHPGGEQALMVGCLLLVLGFRIVDRAGAAYGIAVTGTMAITTILFARRRAHALGLAAVRRSAALAALFLVIDLSFFGANLAQDSRRRLGPARDRRRSSSSLMTTWKRGREIAGSDLLRAVAAARPASSTDIANRKPPRACGHRRVHDVEPGGRAARAAPPPQAQQGAARAGRAALDTRGGCAGGVRRGAITTPELGAGFSRVIGALRLHGDAERPGGARARARSGVSQRAARHDVLPRTGAAFSVRTTAHGALAQEAVRLPVAELAHGDGVLRIPPNRVVELGAQIEL